MKVITTKERQEEGIHSIMPTYFKYQFKEGVYKQTIKAYTICILVVIAMMIFLEETRLTFLVVLGFLVLMSIVCASIIFVGYRKSKKQKLPENIDKVEQVLDENYTISTFYKGGSVDTIEYKYSDIDKVVETKDFYCIFLKNYGVIPLDKQGMGNKEEFINLINVNNIALKEMKSSGNK